jgi:hypothetical protein
MAFSKIDGKIAIEMAQSSTTQQAKLNRRCCDFGIPTFANVFPAELPH